MYELRASYTNIKGNKKSLDINKVKLNIKSSRKLERQSNARLVRDCDRDMDKIYIIPKERKKEIKKYKGNQQ